MDQAAAFAVQFQPPPAAATSADAHSTPAANPTPTLSQPAASHPSYIEMIKAAIEWDNSQGKAGGSSKRAIAKYIDRVYSNLPPTHSALLTHHLKRLKNSGNLVMLKNSYQLPTVAAAAAVNIDNNNNNTTHNPTPLRSAPPQPHYPVPSVPDTNPTPKKRPGRPPKLKQAQAQAETQSQPQPISAPAVGNGSASGKRPRGRPPKQQQPAVTTAEVPFVQPVSQVQPVYVNIPDPGMNNGVATPKRRPGRPPKIQQAAQPVYQAAGEVQPQAQQIVASPVNGAVKRRAGRPPKTNVGPVATTAAVAPPPPYSGKPRGRPRRNPLGPVSMPVGKRPRGRPPRQVGVAAAAVADATGGVAIGVKPRGRPPKGSGPKPVKQQRRVSTGRPRGRPKRDASVTGIHASEQGQVVANEELLRRLENMQLEIRDAVGVIRPYVANQNALDALTALQKLEGLSAMDLTVSPTETAPPVMTLPTTTTAPPPSTSAPESVAAAAPPSLTAPAMMTVNAPQAMGAPSPFSVAPLPFSINVPTMTVTAPLHAPPSIDGQQPMSWIPSSGAQS